MNEKQVNRLLMIGYAGIILAYGILLWVKTRPSEPDKQQIKG